MNRMTSHRILALALALVSALPSAAMSAGGVRGLPAGQAVYYNGYYGVAPVAYGAPAYAYAAPAVAAPQVAYYRGYPVAPVYYPAGVAVAPAARVGYYAPPASYAGYAPTTAYYAPPTPGYAIAPAGMTTQAYAYYPQQQPLNYIPPTYRYETRMVQIPVTYYRPVTVYQPGTGVATTCQKACTGTTCQPSRFRLFSWLHHGSCSSGACSGTTCNMPVATAAPCGTPYYNTVPGAAVPLGTTVVPGTVTTPPRGLGNILAPRTTVPPPGTRVIVPGTSVPADSRPALDPGTVIPSRPSTVIPGSSNPPPPSSFNSGSGYAPADEYSVPAYGSGFKSSGIGTSKEGIRLNRPTITEPGLKQPAATIRPVPDPEGTRRTKPGSKAPALLNPNDRTATHSAASKSALDKARGNSTWAVIPAEWPTKTRNVSLKVNAQPAPVVAQEDQWDASGWKSVRE